MLLPRFQLSPLAATPRHRRVSPTPQLRFESRRAAAVRTTARQRHRLAAPPSFEAPASAASSAQALRLQWRRLQKQQHRQQSKKLETKYQHTSHGNRRWCNSRLPALLRKVIRISSARCYVTAVSKERPIARAPLENNCAMDCSSSLPLRGDGRPPRKRRMTAKMSGGEVRMPSLVPLHEVRLDNHLSRSKAHQLEFAAAEADSVPREPVPRILLNVRNLAEGQAINAAVQAAAASAQPAAAAAASSSSAAPSPAPPPAAAPSKIASARDAAVQRGRAVMLDVLPVGECNHVMPCPRVRLMQEHVIAPGIINDQDVLIDNIKRADPASVSAAEHPVAARLIVQAITHFLPSDQRRPLAVTTIPAHDPHHQPFGALVEAVISGLPELQERVRFVQLLQRKHVVAQRSALPAADRAQRTDLDAADAAALEAVPGLLDMDAADVLVLDDVRGSGRTLDTGCRLVQEAYRTSLPRGAALFAPAAVWNELRAVDGAPGAYLHPDTELGRCIGHMRQWLPGSPNLEANWGSEVEQMALLEQAPSEHREVCRCALFLEYMLSHVDRKDWGKGLRRLSSVPQAVLGVLAVHGELYHWLLEERIFDLASDSVKFDKLITFPGATSYADVPRRHTPPAGLRVQHIKTAAGDPRMRRHAVRSPAGRIHAPRTRHHDFNLARVPKPGTLQRGDGTVCCGSNSEGRETPARDGDIAQNHRLPVYGYCAPPRLRPQGHGAAGAHADVRLLSNHQRTKRAAVNTLTPSAAGAARTEATWAQGADVPAKNLQAVRDIVRRVAADLALVPAPNEQDVYLLQTANKKRATATAYNAIFTIARDELGTGAFESHLASKRAKTRILDDGTSATYKEHEAALAGLEGDRARRAAAKKSDDVLFANRAGRCAGLTTDGVQLELDALCEELDKERVRSGCDSVEYHALLEQAIGKAGVLMEVEMQRKQDQEGGEHLDLLLQVACSHYSGITSSAQGALQLTPAGFHAHLLLLLNEQTAETRPNSPVALHSGSSAITKAAGGFDAHVTQLAGGAGVPSWLKAWRVDDSQLATKNKEARKQLQQATSLYNLGPRGMQVSTPAACHVCLVPSYNTKRPMRCHSSAQSADGHGTGISWAWQTMSAFDVVLVAPLQIAYKAATGKTGTGKDKPVLAAALYALSPEIASASPGPQSSNIVVGALHLVAANVADA
ncbi:hypothetical protein JKP88DRAFT_265908 [Tribonema minus]|uniref:Uncharacterized protein n=1 Tax=Tribonema minus TaxID=303371 RepID=A0A835YIP2_9STRA|nr:hypothetical protein JKP88DRAFT_265908 [Tribonema minus]